MKNDKAGRDELVIWLRKNDPYWEMDSSTLMHRMNDVYQTLKKENEK
jgi:hypothetical protein